MIEITQEENTFLTVKSKNVLKKRESENTNPNLSSFCKTFLINKGQCFIKRSKVNALKYNGNELFRGGSVFDEPSKELLFILF